MFHFSTCTQIVLLKTTPITINNDNLNVGLIKVWSVILVDSAMALKVLMLYAVQYIRIRIVPIAKSQVFKIIYTLITRDL